MFWDLVLLKPAENTGGWQFVCLLFFASVRISVFFFADESERKRAALAMTTSPELPAHAVAASAAAAASATQAANKKRRTSADQGSLGPPPPRVACAHCSFSTSSLSQSLAHAREHYRPAEQRATMRDMGTFCLKLSCRASLAASRLGHCMPLRRDDSHRK